MLDCPSQSSMRLQRAETTTKPLQALMHCSALKRTVSPEISASLDATASYRALPSKESSTHNLRLARSASAALAPRAPTLQRRLHHRHSLLGCGSALIITIQSAINAASGSLYDLVATVIVGLWGKLWLHCNISRRDQAAQYVPISLNAVLTTGFYGLIT